MSPNEVKNQGAWRVGLLGAIMFITALGIARFAYTPLLPGLIDELGWSISQAGDIASANFLGYLVGAMLAAYLSRGSRARFWLITGLLATALTTVLAWAVTGYPAWLLLRFTSGVASAIVMVFGTGFVVQQLARRARPNLIAMQFAGVGLGIVVSVLVVEFARYRLVDVHQTWLYLGLISAVLVTVAIRWISVIASQTVHEVASLSPAANTPVQSISRSLLARITTAYGLFGFGYVISATFVVSIARSFELDADGAGALSLLAAHWLEPLTWIVVGFGATPSVMIWQFLAGRFGALRALRWAFFVQTVGVLLAGFAVSMSALLVGSALLGLTFPGITALGLSTLREFGHSSTQIVGWMTAAFGLGQLIGPAVAGRMAQYSGNFESASLLAAGFLVLGGVLLFSPGPSRRNK